MIYETKRQRIIREVKATLRSFKLAGRDTALIVPFMANISLSTGAKEKDVLEVLKTFENASDIKLNGENIDIL